MVLVKEGNVLSGGPRTGEEPSKVGQRCKQSQPQVSATEELSGMRKRKVSRLRMSREEALTATAGPGAREANVKVQPSTQVQETPSG